MTEAFDWGLLIVAGASLIFAAFAFRMVRRTTGRIDGYIDKFPKNPATMLKDPDFAAEVMTKVITGGQKLPDGSPAMVTDIMTGYMNAYVPVMIDHLEKKIPEYIPLFLNHAYGSSPPGTQGPSEAGRALSNARWGSGGLKAAQSVAKIAGKAGVGDIAGKIRGATEVVGALMEVKPLIEDIKGLVGKGGGTGGNGGEESTSTASGPTAWRDPF